MAANTQPKPSFSPYRHWGIGFHVGFLVFIVLSVVVMINYLSRDYSTRFYLSPHTRNPLSPQTIQLLRSLTNQVQVIVYYDRDDPYFGTVVSLLNEYHRVSPRISVRVVDHTRDVGAAQQLKVKYAFLAASSANNAASAKNAIIFDAGEGRVKPVDGDQLTERVPELKPNQTYRLRATAFLGERAFTSTLATVINPKPLKAYFLQGHGEHQFDSGEKLEGYLKLASVIRENYAQVDSLSLLTTNATVPADCSLLVVAGPTHPLAETELAKIDQYLNQGGHSMLVLFNAASLKNGNTGLEGILAKWGVDVTAKVIEEPEKNIRGTGVIADVFSRSHPIVNPLWHMQLPLYLVSPRSIGALRASNRPDAPVVEELVFSSPRSYVRESVKREERSYPLAVAVEKGAIPGVVTGTTRLVVAGDSLFLANAAIQSVANRDFASFAANWLLDRHQLLGGLGPRPVAEYTLVMTKAQLRSLQWILLAGMPGGVLLLGVVVWFWRRS
jgi:ABC-2 type transport system permease protein